MKLKIIELKENEDYRDGIKYIVDDVELSFIDGEPEDATLGRDFCDVYKIKDLIKKLFPEIEIEETEEDLTNW